MNAMRAMNRFIVSMVLLTMAVATVWAIDVDQQELETSVTNTISFINNSGPHDDIDSIDEIRAIGVSISTQIASGQSAEFAGKYRITHVLPSADSPLRGADILELLPSARVDHIDNLRRIISAYLESRYGYSPEDAQLLGVLATVYNAVHRGNLERFQQAYVPEVAELLDAQRVGLSLNWEDWAGASQIVIPLASDAAPGELSSVPADELLDEAVEETLSDAPDQSMEQRMDAADLIDRTVDEESTQAETERSEIDQQREELAQQEQELDEQIDELEEEIASLPEDSPQQQELEEELETARQEQQEVEQERETLEQRETQVEQREEQAASAQQRSDEIREEVAEDIENSSTQAQQSTRPLRFSRARISNDSLFTTLVIVDVVDGSVLASSNREILGRGFLETRQGYLAISQEAGTPVLVLLDSEDLSFVSAGSAEISSYSPIVAGTQDDYYAVINDGGEWYAGRFDANLNLLFRSSIPVSQGSDLLIDGDSLIVQRKDGRFTSLDLDELKVGP